VEIYFVVGSFVVIGLVVYGLFRENQTSDIGIEKYEIKREWIHEIDSDGNDISYWRITKILKKKKN
jgi:hypothetical protein